MSSFLMEGEIIAVQKKILEYPAILYTVNVRTPGGRSIILTNVEDATMYGGISDYSRRVARAKYDYESDDNSISANDINATVGERVYVLPLYGNILSGIIIGYKQHPIQVEEPDLGKSLKKVEQFYGFRTEYDEDGQVRIIRKGAPTLKYAPNMKANNSPFPGDKSPAISPAPRSEKIIQEYLNGGLYRVRDPEGGMIEIDHITKKGVYISNNDWKSDEDATRGEASGGLSNLKGTDSEFIWLNREEGLVAVKSRKKIQFFTNGDRDDTTEGNHSYKVGGNSVVNISGNDSRTVDGKYKLAVSGNAKLTMGDGKVALGANGIEIFDTLIKLMGEIIQELTTLQAHTHIANLGYPTAPPNEAAAFASVQQKVTKLQLDLTSVKGSL